MRTRFYCAFAALCFALAVPAAFAARTGLDESALAAEAVINPDETVSADVERLLASPKVSERITAAGYVYDLDSGLVRMVVPPARPRPAQQAER